MPLAVRARRARALCASTTIPLRLENERCRWRQGEVRCALRCWRCLLFPLLTALPPTRPLCSFVPETVLKSRKQRDALLASAKAARKDEKAKSKTRRAGMLTRAEQYMNGASLGGLFCAACGGWVGGARTGGGGSGPMRGGREAASLIKMGSGSMLSTPLPNPALLVCLNTRIEEEARD